MDISHDERCDFLNKPKIVNFIDFGRMYSVTSGFIAQLCLSYQ